MRNPVSLCLVAALMLSAFSLAGCSSNSRRPAARQSGAAVAYRPAPASTATPTHERVVATWDAPAAPSLPGDEATFVQASRPAPAKSSYAGVAAGNPCDPCDPCAAPVRQWCPPKIRNPFCAPKCCPPSG